jgi:hypothetical protein
MRIALGQIQNFPDQASLLSYCASNPDQEAGYAPAGQTSPQTLPCQRWPYVFGQGQVLLMGGTATTSLTSATLAGIPIWLIAVAGLGLFLMMRKP